MKLCFAEYLEKNKEDRQKQFKMLNRLICILEKDECDEPVPVDLSKYQLANEIVAKEEVEEEEEEEEAEVNMVEIKKMNVQMLCMVDKIKFVM